MNYQISNDGSRAETMSVEQIREHWIARKINGKTLAWREGMEIWMPLSLLADELDLPALAAPQLTQSHASAAPADSTELLREISAKLSPPTRRGLFGFVVWPGEVQILIGVFLAIYFLCFFETGVSTGLGGRVLNMSLAHQQQLGVLIACTFFLSGNVRRAIAQK